MAESGGDEGSKENHDAERDNQTTPPMTLVYLDSLCDRGRLEFLLATLQQASEGDVNLVDRLYATATNHALKRLCRIINETRQKERSN